jgi:hypothetical protein
MANVRMLFHGDVTSECSEKTVEVYVNTKKKLFIEIRDFGVDFFPSQHTVLDKQTAIKLSKELRKQIALMD